MNCQLSDEELKQQILKGGLAKRTCEGVIEIARNKKTPNSFNHNYFIPKENIPKNGDLGKKLKKAFVIIPMHEKGPVIRPVLDYLTGIINPKKIIVVNDRSDEEACQAAQKYGVTLIDKEKIFSLLNWEKILAPILKINDIPFGKGMCVMAGYLYLFLKFYYKKIECDWIIQHDSELAECRNYKALHHLAYPLEQETKYEYIKIAKWGRGNESCMTARNMLYVLWQLENNKTAKAIYEQTVHHKWMLSGEFMLTPELAFSRPFGSGYLEETIISIFAPKSKTAQVYNPNSRLDGSNLLQKETTMQQIISNFLLLLALKKIDLTNPKLDTITILNQAMSYPFQMGWISPDDKPVRAEIVKMERIIPSVKTLWEKNLIDKNKTKKFLSEMD